MALDATIVEVPKPPAGRLPFLRLLARLVSNPVASWGEDFYDEPIVVYRDFGLETVFVTDPVLTQQILLDDSDAITKSPLYDNVLGRAGGKGLLIAEGEDWRWQRRIAAPLFGAEAILSYAPAFAAACEPVLASWRKAELGSLQIIGKDMTDAAMQALQDTILGADLGEQERKMV
jgi:cytochrome P450